MTDGTRVLKTVAVPLAIALVFLFFVPKMCSKVMGSKKLRPPTPTASAAADTALHISSDSPDAPASRSVNYPAGLDAQRVQYLIEINERFAVIAMAEMFNTFNNANNVNPLIAPALFNFDGFLREGVGDPRQVQLAVKLTF